MNKHLYYAAFAVFAIEKKMFVTIFIFSYVGIANVSNLFSAKSLARLDDVLHVSTIMYLINSYVCEFEVLQYVNTCMLSFINPVWVLISSVLFWQIILHSIL